MIRETEKSWLIAGLGNPGSLYDATRHNLGFAVLDALSDAWRIPLSQKKFKAVWGKGTYHTHKVWLVQPQTYMNLSGEAIKPLLQYFKIPEQQVIVCHDDLDLPPGQLKVKQNGGDGGHRGIRSLRQHLEHGDFIRLRLGVGRPPGKAADFVLQKIRQPDRELFQQLEETTLQAVETIIEHGVITAMNRFNQK